MHWLDDLAYLFAGAFLTNAIPHLAAGLMGRPFQSPFAKPPGEGLSSSRTNVLWGFANLVVAWLLFTRVGAFDIHDPEFTGVALAGGLIIGVLLAQRFGRFNGGNTPTA